MKEINYMHSHFVSFTYLYYFKSVIVFLITVSSFFTNTLDII